LGSNQFYFIFDKLRAWVIKKKKKKDEKV